jgi:cytochrome c oxidase subunit 2
MFALLLQNVLQPAGPQAGRVSHLWWFIFWMTTIIYVLVIAAMLWSFMRRRRANPDDASEERSATTVVGAATAITVLLVLVVLVASSVTGHNLATPPQGPVDITVRGNQWWWYVEYMGGKPSDHVVTANEIHIPVGRPARIHLDTSDVIHSFWVPNLAGKLDAIPDHRNVFWLQADKPGVYPGECAEFCGFQHAHMRFFVFADPPDKFASWLGQQQAEARIPQTDEQERGRQTFLKGPCVICHQIRGTTAHGNVAPDLTHVGSRTTIAAGTLPLTRGNLTGWIIDSQRIKPGNHMPGMNLSSDEVQDIAAYLESLK